MNYREIDVLLVDNSEIFQGGVAAALEPYHDINLIGTTTDAGATINFLSRCVPNVVIIDIMIPDKGGTRVIQYLEQNYPNVNIIILTHQRTVELVHEAFSCGALSYLMKDITRDELINAVREASRGNTIIAYEVAQALIKKPKTSSHIEESLTAREQEVMQLLMKGYKNSDIAEELVITLATVKKHVRKILTKLDVESRTEAVAVAYEYKFAQR